MRKRGWMASVGICALLLLGCQSKPQVVPEVAPVVPAPTVPSVPALPKPTFKRGTIFFLKGDARISPGAVEKLQTWTSAWGVDGTWVLAYAVDPEIPASLTEQRLQALRVELKRLGVATIETKIVPKDPGGQYDAIKIEK